MPPAASPVSLVAGHPLDGLGAPVGAHIGKDLGRAGQQVAEEHANAVQGIVLGGHDEGLADAVPVEGGVEDGLHEIAVGKVVRPLALPLEAGGDGIVAQGLLAKAQLGQARIADHQVAGDQGHLDGHGPVLVLLLAAALRLPAGYSPCPPGSWP